MDLDTLPLAECLPTELPALTKESLIDRLARSTLTKRLHGMRGGALVLRDSAGTVRLGETSDLEATVKVHRPRFYRRAILGGSLAVADTYLQGDWDCDDLTSLFRLFLRNSNASDRLDNRFAKWMNLGNRVLHLLRNNSIKGSRKNIQAHYDLGNDFYQMWLDETMAYSSGIFSRWDASMKEASTEKFDRICRKLALRPTDNVLEIGTGFGGLAMHAAKNYGCRVTTTTISNEQYAFARQQIDRHGLSDRITLLQRDYRDLAGRFDKIVSIEMIEAVGHQYLDQFFRQCGNLLRENGTMLLQSIIMPEKHYPRYLSSVDFIQRYVFPGGSLPSVSALLESAGRTSDLRFVHLEDFAPHYAETLRRWRGSFHRHIDAVRGLGYPERLVRMWNYYLCYCEAAFEERYIGVMHLQFDGPRCLRDPMEIGRRAESYPVDRADPCLNPQTASRLIGGAL
ncbi:MAG: cyclopropane-fatty-acyl-phospholipid synthase family protein [Planctomycetota bacterium]